MTNEDEIFKTYALKRLSEGNPMLDDFPSYASESLAYLSKATGVSVLPANDTYLKTETDQFGEKQKYVVENIDESSLAKKRAQNIERLTAKLSPETAKKIKAFEEATKYIHHPDMVSKEDMAEFLGKSLALFSNNDVLSSKIRITINKKIQDLTGKKLTPQQQKSIEKKEKKKVAFYDTLKKIHQPCSNEDRIVLYKTLLKNIDAQDYADVPVFGDVYTYGKTQDEIKKAVSSQKAHIKTELKRDIAEQIYKLYRADFRKEADFWKQELDAYQEGCSHYAKRLLGPKGAFAQGGVYGPDSKFAARPKNQPKVTELSLFSDKDFQY